MQEVSCPYMPWKLCLCSLKGLCGPGMFLSGYHRRSLEVKKTVYPIDLFVINSDTLLLEFSPYKSVSPGSIEVHPKSWTLAKTIKRGYISPKTGALCQQGDTFFTGQRRELVMRVVRK